MGTMTVTDIVNEGGLIAGDTSLAVRAKVELKAWLRSQYAAFLWPFLKGWIQNVSLNAGAVGLTLGAGSGGVTQHIQRIIDPLYIYPSDYTFKAPVRIVTDSGDAEASMADSLLVGQATGQPTVCRVQHTTTPGQRNLSFDYKADRNYKLKIGYFFVPADPGDSEIPIYPNDRTLIQAVMVFVLKYKKADNYGEELSILVNQVNDDRLKYGSEPGQNDQLFLDPKTFR